MNGHEVGGGSGEDTLAKGNSTCKGAEEGRCFENSESLE